MQWTVKSVKKTHRARVVTIQIADPPPGVPGEVTYEFGLDIPDKSVAFEVKAYMKDIETQAVAVDDPALKKLIKP